VTGNSNFGGRPSFYHHFILFFSSIAFN